MADTRKEHVSFRLDPEITERIERIARKETRTRSNMMEILLRTAVEAYEAGEKVAEPHARGRK